MIITLIRHLPTEWNKKTWLQGRKDIGLSPVTEEFQTKITQNQQLLNQLPPVEIVLASTLKRTHQTALLYGFDAETEGLLDELDFGPFEGVPKEKLIEKYGVQWLENPRDLVLGESLKNLEKRIMQFLDKYKSRSHILVFGHGSWIRALISYLHHGNINKMNTIQVENNACVTVEVKNKGQ